MALATRALRGLALDLSQRALSNVTENDQGVFPYSNNNNSPSHDTWTDETLHNMNDDQAHTTSNQDPFIDERLGLIIFLLSTITSVVLVLTMILREYYFKRYGVDVCRIFSTQERAAMERRRRADTDQQDADRALAEQLQRQLNEEEREAERLVKRQERRKWYEYYLRPLTMTVESKDIFYAREMEQENNHSNGNESHEAHSASESLPKQLRRLSTTDDSEDGKEVIKISAGSFDEEDDEEVSETAKPLAPELIEPEPVLCCEDEEDAHLYLRLPAKKQVGCQDDKDDESQQQKEQETHRHVDGQCALCIDDYEAGDQVVWSDLECPHAFHKECIMQWLSKGKKRCPVCRNWFVPGARIDDQKKLHGEDWERAAAAMQHQEDEQIVPDAIDLEHGNNPAAIDIEQQSESPEIAPSTTEESDNDDGTTPATSIDNNSNQHHEHFCGLQCPSYTLGLRSTSETSELDTLQRKQQSPAQQKHTTSSTRLVVDTIEECTLSENNHTATYAAITDDCCRAENSMDISAETEEAVSRRSSFEEV